MIQNSKANANVLVGEGGTTADIINNSKAMKNLGEKTRKDMQNLQQTRDGIINDIVKLISGSWQRLKRDDLKPLTGRQPLGL